MLVAPVLAAVVALPFAPASARTHANRFAETDLVSDQPGKAQITDPNLVNAWGMAAGPTSPIWVSDNGTDVTTLYKGATAGVPISTVPLVVSIPGGAPTGQAFNPSTDFVVHAGAASAPALFGVRRRVRPCDRLEPRGRCHPRR